MNARHSRNPIKNGEQNDVAELEHFEIEVDVLSVCSKNDPSLHEGVLYQFVRFSVFCAAVPACALACLALATAQLGSIGARQSGVLYATYTLFSFVGATTLIVQRIGSRDTIILGQVLFGAYVALFWVAFMVLHHSTIAATVFAWVGAGVGGVGASILWTAQGIYFAETTQAYSAQNGRKLEESTSLLAGVFAFAFLVEETLINVMATILVKAGIPWHMVFMIYTCVTIIAIFATTTAHAYPRQECEHGVSGGQSVFSKASGAVILLLKDSRAKYMIGFNAAFGFAGAYLNSFISGQVVSKIFNDASFVGILVAIHGITAACASLYFARINSKLPAVFIGSLAFAGVAIPALLQPNIEKDWGWGHLLFIYAIHGVGRASFEGPMKAVVADLFPRDADAAFTNITLQNGVASSFAYFLVNRLRCKPITTSANSFCFAYQDGSYHNIRTMGCVVIGTSIVSILGFARICLLTKSSHLTNYTLSESMPTLYRSKEVYIGDIPETIDDEEQCGLPEIL